MLSLRAVRLGIMLGWGPALRNIVVADRAAHGSERDVEWKYASWPNGDSESACPPSPRGVGGLV